MICWKAFLLWPCLSWMEMRHCWYENWRVFASSLTAETAVMQIKSTLLCLPPPFARFRFPCFLKFVRSFFFIPAGLLQPLVDFLYVQMDCFWDKRWPSEYLPTLLLTLPFSPRWCSPRILPIRSLKVTISNGLGIWHCYLPCSHVSWSSTPQLTVTEVCFQPLCLQPVLPWF